MFKKVLIAAAIVIANPAFVSAQDIFWSFSPTAAQSSTFLLNPIFPNSEPSSAYIFSDGPFSFDALDLNFSTSNSDVTFTGGQAFNPTFDVIGGRRFDASELTIDATGSSGNFFSVTVLQNGVDSALSPMFDPGFEAGVGPNGAVLLARVDFEFDPRGGSAVFDFTLGDLGAIQLPDIALNPSFGSASLTFGPLTPKGPPGPLGDVNLDGDVDFFDIQPFIDYLSSGFFICEADINLDGVVDLLDVAPFISILSSQ